MKIININPNNPRQITAIPVIGFAEYKIIPRGKVVLYYEMKSLFFGQNISHNLTLTDEQFEEWGNDDEYIINLILEAEKLSQIYIEEEEISVTNINPLPILTPQPNVITERTNQPRTEPTEPTETVTYAN